MTDEQKDILMAKMLDAPSSLSDVELDAIVHDDELRDIYEISVAVSGACLRHPEFDVKQEWKRFAPRLRRKPSAMRRVMRVAAIFIGVAVLSGVVATMTDSRLTSGSTAEMAWVELPPTSGGNILSIAVPPATVTDSGDAAPVLNKKKRVASQEKINAKTEISENGDFCETDDPDIDIDEYIRIQQARIDNDLAMQTAEIIADEYNFIGEIDMEIENFIQKVTMQ